MMAVFGGVLLGCQHFERGGDCRTIADAVNPELSVLATHYAKYSPVSADEFRAASKRYDAAAARLDTVHFKIPEMTSFAAQMKDNLRSAARSCDRIAANLARREPIANSQAYKELEAQHQRHSTLIASIDHACQQQ